MTFPLEILLLGGLQTRQNGQPLTGFASRKAEALLAYLAFTGKPQPRERLADLFWDDRSTAQALGNLRVLLSSLRKLLGDAILITRQQIALAPQSCRVDVLDFEQAVNAVRRRESPLCEEDARQLEDALNLYTGDFFFGVYLRQSSRFMEWVSMQREHLHLLALDAMYDLVTYAKACGDYETGLQWADRILQVDALREEVHREKMILLARSGRRDTALEQYRLCRQALADGLGLEPDEETEALYRRLQQARTAYRHNLPTQPTPFVGRHAELEQLTALLHNPAARLVTLYGPGGIGKTRLALQAASDNGGDFLQGVTYLSLAQPTDAPALVAALNDILQLPPNPKTTPRASLIQHLRTQEILLLLDNFELYHGKLTPLSDLLHAAPHLKLLVTARLPLHLRGEWLMEVDGFDLPSENSLRPLEESPAAQFFVQTARRVRPDFAITAANAAAVRAICVLVMGNPLGIELAAAWVGLLSPAEIAEAIGQDLGVLATANNDVPDRQRSLRGVLEQSWNLLQPQAQQVMARLAVCRGGFTWEAARVVGQANLPVMADLVKHSFVRRLPQERYTMHELLRQYALEKGSQSDGLLAESAQRHADHYLTWLAGLYSDLTGPQQAACFSQITLEIDNLRTAWDQALQAGRFDLATRAADSLAAYFENAGHYPEAQALFERFANRLPANAEASWQAAANHYWGWFVYRVGSLQQAIPLIEVSITRYQQAADLPGEANALCALAMVLLQRGEAARAAALGEQSLAHSRQTGDLVGQGRALNLLGVLAKQQGHSAEARQIHEQALAIHRLLGDVNRIAGSINNLGVAARALGQHADALRFYAEALQLRRQGQNQRGIALAQNNLANAQAEVGDYQAAAEAFGDSLSICESIGDDWGRALALHNLGDLALNLNNSGLAAERYHQSLALRQQIGDLPGVAYSLAGLGRARLAQGDRPAARQHLHTAIHQALELNLQPAALSMLAIASAGLLLPDQPAIAYILACFVHAHPAADSQARRRAAETLTTLENKLPADERETLRQRGEGLTLQEIREITDSFLR